MKILILLSVSFALSACRTWRFAETGNDQGRSAFEFCDGQIMGFRQLVNDPRNPSVLVFLENRLDEKSDRQIITFLIHSRTDLNIKFKNRYFSVKRSKPPDYNLQAQFLIVLNRKTIHELYPPNNFSVEPVEGSKDQWKISRYHYGFIKEEPFTVTQQELPPHQTDTNEMSVDFNEANFNDVYVSAKLSVPLEGPKLEDGAISLVTPEFTLNTVLVPSQVYQFNFSRKIFKHKAGAHLEACAPLEEILKLPSFWSVSGRR